MAKYSCIDAASEAVNEAKQIHGGISSTDHYRGARFYYDLGVERISGGANVMVLLTSVRTGLKECRNKSDSPLAAGGVRG